MIDFAGKRKSKISPDTNDPTKTPVKELPVPQMYLVLNDGRETRLDDVCLFRLLENNQGKVTFGSSDDCQLCCKLSRSVSRKHFLLEKCGEDIFIQDLNSKNGTYINNARITERTKLEHKTVIAAGRVKLLFCFD